MSAVAVLRLPLTVDLSGFVKLLQRMQVPHRVSEEAGQQVRCTNGFQQVIPISNWTCRPRRNPSVRVLLRNCAPAP
jgi:hypothetical protein